MPELAYRYGVAIDAGLLGLRVQVYHWPDPDTSSSFYPPSLARHQAVPHVLMREGWNHKIKGGILGYAYREKDLWDDHLEPLVEFAEGIVPKEKRSETPIYVLATAGMRMLPKWKQTQLLKHTCRLLQKKTLFLLPNCEDFVQVIDGGTEGMYGWIGLNHLAGTFDGSGTLPLGFMDMGGALTQVAFVPQAGEVEKHREDLRTVVLRSIDGATHEWPVFVLTWLGFGANQARDRYLRQMVGLHTVNGAPAPTKLRDPCMLKGASTKYHADHGSVTVEGTGDHKRCLESMQPLLLKDLPCEDEPCLFNGVHVPKIDFTADRFVGISEYWYTAHDVFDLGGDYSFAEFERRSAEFCSTPWDEALSQKHHGRILEPDILLNACFKAAWVANVLHNGFDLPRVGIEAPADGALPHVPFHSADKIRGKELLWTLGKMVLFAASQVPVPRGSAPVGIRPSALEMSVGHVFVPGGAAASATVFLWWWVLVFAMLLVAYAAYTRPSQVRLALAWALRTARAAHAYVPPHVRLLFRTHGAAALLRVLRFLPDRLRAKVRWPAHLLALTPTDEIEAMEQGMSFSLPVLRAQGLRTRSVMGLNDMDQGRVVVPQRSATNLYNQRQNQLAFFPMSSFDVTRNPLVRSSSSSTFEGQHPP